MNKGNWHKLIRIDVSHGSIKEEAIDEDIEKKFIGGAGVGAYYLWDEVRPDVDALDSENRIIFTTGPFQASKIPGAAKFSIVSKSPLTGIFADTAAGAKWGITFKKCGYDFLIIQGASTKPVYLFIENQSAQLLDASEIWGKDAYETERLLNERHPGASVAAIGPAGENLVAMANICVDGFSMAGRCGLGAVLGSKKVKAVVVKGSLSPQVYDPDALKQLEKEYRKSIGENASFLHDSGTVVGLAPGEEAGNLPLKNWSMVGWADGAAKIGQPGYNDTLKPKPHPCLYCTVGCHRSVDLVLSNGETFKGPGPEYETMAMLGSNCLIDDLEGLVKTNDYCNRMGIDTMSAGSCAAFAMEALEREHTAGKKPGYDFTWGNIEGLNNFLEEVVHQKGFGGIFSKGIKHAAEIFKPESKEYACHVKGLDVPGHDPRVYFNLALSYATGNRGACHMRAYSQISTMGALLPEAGISEAPAPDTLVDAAHVVKVYQDFSAFYNACVLCQFMIWGGFGLSDMVKVLNAITGWDMSVEDVMQSGDRIFTLQRMINNGYGITSEDDVLPKRFFEPSREGARAGKVPDPFYQSLTELYEERGWDRKGFPNEEKIAELEIKK